MNILFRADSSSQIGTGHIMRDLVLAKQFKDNKITFAARDLKGNINHRIEEAGYAVKTLNSNNFEELDSIIKNMQIDLLVIDHYGIDYYFEKQLKQSNTRLKLMVLDDTYERHYCDIVLNHNISAQEDRYKQLVPSQCELRCGSRYTLLRDEFYIEKKKRKIKNITRKNILISLGGTDNNNLNIKILKILNNYKNIHVDLTTSNSNKNLKNLQKFIKNKKWVNLHINTNQIAKIMKKSDFAIVTPSVTVNEVYFMGVPFIAVMTAHNQIEIHNYLKKKKYHTMDKFNTQKFKLLFDFLFKVRYK